MHTCRPRKFPVKAGAACAPRILPQLRDATIEYRRLVLMFHYSWLTLSGCITLRNFEAINPYKLTIVTRSSSPSMNLFFTLNHAGSRQLNTSLSKLCYSSECLVKWMNRRFEQHSRYEPFVPEEIKITMLKLIDRKYRSITRASPVVSTRCSSILPNQTTQVPKYEWCAVQDGF